MAKKKHAEEHENLERWLVSYADFITLLFAFFTILYALGQTDKAKLKGAMESIQKAFMSAGGIAPLRGSPMSPFDRAPDAGSMTPPSPEDSGKFSEDQKEAMSKIAEDLKALFEQTTGSTIGPKDIEVFPSTGGYKIRLGEAMLFSSGSDKLRKQNAAFLYELGKRLKRTGHSIQIEGHADNREQDARSPWQVSLARSSTLAQFLTEGSGFPKDKIVVSGHGATKPLGDNKTPEGRARNRRVEISVLVPDANKTQVDW